MSYGRDVESLGPWYNLEDILKTFPKWRIPDPSKYYNMKKFNAQARRDLQESKKERKRNRYPPIDQSSNDIQGGRGRGRGRGSERGTFQPQYRGRGRPFYSEGDRPYYRQDDRNKEREYREWDASQSADPSSRRTHEEESWQKYQEYMEYQQEGQHRDPPGYYTKEFEDRKRARSPSPRGERPNRRDKSYDRQGSRRDYNQESRRDYNQESRRDYNQESRRDYSYELGRRDYSSERQSRRDYSPGHRQDSGRGRGRRDYTPDESRRYPGQNR